MPMGAHMSAKSLFKQLPQPLRSPLQSFRTIRQLLKIAIFRHCAASIYRNIFCPSVSVDYKKVNLGQASAR